MIAGEAVALRHLVGTIGLYDWVVAQPAQLERLGSTILV